MSTKSPGVRFGRGLSLAGFSASMTAKSFSPIRAYPKAWSPNTDGVVRGEPIDLDAKTPSELERYREKLEGAIASALALSRSVRAGQATSVASVDPP